MKEVETLHNSTDRKEVLAFRFTVQLQVVWVRTLWRAVPLSVTQSNKGVLLRGCYFSLDGK